ncbi:SPW repeat protein [Albidovulum sp.]
MTDFRKDFNKTWADGINLVLGLFLFVAAWIFGYAGITAALWNGLIVGAVITGLAVAALMAWKDWEEWLGVLLGAWMVVSPWVLGFASFTAAADHAMAATVVALIVGIAVLAFSGFSIYAHRDEAGAH